MEVRLAIDPVNAMGALSCSPPLPIAPGSKLMASAAHQWVGGDLTSSNWFKLPNGKFQNLKPDPNHR